MTDVLAPFVATLQADLSVAVRHFLALPASIVLRCQPKQDGTPPILRCACQIGDGNDGLRFDLALPGAWLAPDATGPDLVARWHQRGDLDPVTLRLQRGIAARLAAGGESTAAVAAALLAVGPFAGQNDELFRKVSDSAFGRYGLLRLTFVCNQDCGFCWQGRDWPAPPAELYFVWLDQFAAMGLRTLLVTGGEPTLWPRLAELIARARGVHGMDVLLETNAIRMRQPHVLQSLQEAGLKTLFVSYHSPDAATSDAMTRAPRTHRNTERGVQAWLEAGLEVHLNCVVQPENVHQLADHAAAIVERFVRPFPQGKVGMVSYTQPAPYFDLDHFAAALVPLDEVAQGLTRAARTLAAAGVGVQIDGSCGFPTCLIADVPELMRWQPDLEMADSDAQSRGFAPVCQTCAAQAGCLGVRREYLAQYGDRGLRPFVTLPPALQEQRSAHAGP